MHDALAPSEDALRRAAEADAVPDVQVVQPEVRVVPVEQEQQQELESPVPSLQSETSDAGSLPLEDPDDEDGPLSEVGLPDEEITTWLDTRAYGGQKYDALAAHASQSENIFFLRMGRERFTELMGIETFVRVQDRTGAATPEDDLFAGLP